MLIRPPLRMYYIYVLYSSSYNNIYIGISNNPKVRFIRYNETNKHGWTKKNRPCKLFHQEEFKTKSIVLRREKELKNYRDQKYIREIILKNYKNKLIG